jgi:Zn-dependent peptidase ImmA (M78 family)/transcriptional regulator with XRE-family HTH domain
MSRILKAFVGDQLRLARLTHGMSLEEVASAVAATRQYIHQLENGSRTPAEDLVRALADVLGVKVDFFYAAEAAGVRPEQCHFRKQQTTPASIISQVLARGTMVDRLVNKLDERLTLPTVDFPDLPVHNVEEIEQAAEAARRHWKLGSDGPIVNMMRVVENAGAVVTCFKDLSDRVDALSMDRPRPIIVRSDAKASLCRLRFDLAHEAGHLVMHRGIETGDKFTEDQAHRFAGAFLFPRAAFLQEFPRGRQMNWGVLYQLKLRWKVAVRAMVRRAFDLGIIDAAQYRTANIQIVKNGQAKTERYDDELPLEQPELLSAAIAGMRQIGPEALNDLSDDLGLSSSMYSLLTNEMLPERADLASNVTRFRDYL